MDGDGYVAIGACLDVFSKLIGDFGWQVRIAVGRWHVPLGCVDCGGEEKPCHQGGCRKLFEHIDSPVLLLLLL